MLKVIRTGLKASQMDEKYQAGSVSQTRNKNSCSCNCR